MRTRVDRQAAAEVLGRKKTTFAVSIIAPLPTIEQMSLEPAPSRLYCSEGPTSGICPSFASIPKSGDLLVD
jgi:hypothetical protein